MVVTTNTHQARRSGISSHNIYLTSSRCGVSGHNVDITSSHDVIDLTVDDELDGMDNAEYDEVVDLTEDS
jgi:hypothetical protein